MGGDPIARLLAPNRARPRWGHPWLHRPPPPIHWKPSRHDHSSVATTPCPSRSVTALGDRVGHVPPHNVVVADDGDLPRATPGTHVCPGDQPRQVLCRRWGPGTGYPHRRVAKPAAAPFLGLAGGKYCLCFSIICLLFCICRFFKDREPPLPRFLRRYPQQCRPRSPPHSKKTNVRPRIDMK